ncbi:MAG: hypothetical protein V3W04_06635 [Gammaproteobacteria bacterium]
MELKLYHALIDAGIQAKEAEKVVEALDEKMQQQLATKSDISDLRTDMANLEGRLIKWVSSLMVAMTAIFATIVAMIVKLLL